MYLSFILANRHKTVSWRYLLTSFRSYSLIVQNQEQSLAVPISSRWQHTISVEFLLFRETQWCLSLGYVDIHFRAGPLIPYTGNLFNSLTQSAQYKALHKSEKSYQICTQLDVFHDLTTIYPKGSDNRFSIDITILTINCFILIEKGQ